MRINIPDLIQNLPLDTILRMKIERQYIMSAKKVRKLFGGKAENTSKYYPLVRNNRLYGNEALLRKYANIDDYLYAIIEHGLYFGNNHQKVGLKHEWELGCILTYGEYRRKTIEIYFPDFYCEMIGPIIHYAGENIDFKNRLIKNMNSNERTLLFFPVHGNEYFFPVYDTELTLKKIVNIANKKDCKNIIICVYQGDIKIFTNAVKSSGLNDRIQITSCGNRYNEDFLCNQKAMISLADITISNQLGTHLGYCIYMQKPHILLHQELVYKGDKKIIWNDFGMSNRSDNWKDDFEKEQQLFLNVFNSNTDKISEEQYNLCNYFWGYTKIKSPSEIKEIFKKCKIKAGQ